jgi:small multidrug resistance pump
MTSWLYLIGAILLEVGGTTAMKLSEGFTRLIPSIAMSILYIGSLALLTLALKKFEVGFTYAVWSGLGTAIIAIIGVYYFKEPASLLKVASIALIILGVVGLNLSNAHG